MQFVISSTKLLKELARINGVVASNPVVPILENFLFDLQPDKLLVTASDLQTTMTLELDEVKAETPGRIAIPARILMDTLKNLPDQPVTFSIDEDTYSIEIVSRNGHYKLSGENAVDFPKVPEPPKGGQRIEVATDILARAVGNTIFATSNDELRPAMTGVLAQLQDAHATFVATDGHRLVRYRRRDVGTEGDTSLILPRRALTLLKNSLPSESTTLQLSFNQSNAFFHFQNLRMVCRLIDERFPDYENAIPVNNPHVVTIDRHDLLGCLKRIAIYANKTTHQVRFRLSANELEVSAEDLDFSNEASEVLACEYEGTPMEIGFNARLLMEMLQNLESDVVKISLSAPNRAGLIVPAEPKSGEDVLMLVMPVMLNNYA